MTSPETMKGVAEGDEEKWIRMRTEVAKNINAGEEENKYDDDERYLLAY